MHYLHCLHYSHDYLVQASQKSVDFFWGLLATLVDNLLIYIVIIIYIFIIIIVIIITIIIVKITIIIMINDQWSPLPHRWIITYFLVETSVIFAIYRFQVIIDHQSSSRTRKYWLLNPWILDHSSLIHDQALAGSRDFKAAKIPGFLSDPGKPGVRSLGPDVRE